MKIIFVRNKNISPAGFYRICQYVNENDDIIISQYSVDSYYKSILPRKIRMLFYGFIPGYLRRVYVILKALKSRDSVDIFVQRRIFVKKTFWLDRFLLKKLFAKANRIIWDFDDNIFSNSEITEYETKLLINNSDDIVVPNKFLANKIIESSAKIHFIPTTDASFESIRLDLINEKRKKNYDNEIKILWLGTRSNIKYLIGILPFIDEAARILEEKGKRITLINVSDAKIVSEYNNVSIKNIRWKREIAIKEMLACHIGLMPLETNNYTSGKAAFKAIQYMSAGMPTILSPVGYNREIITHSKNGFFAKDGEEWTRYIISLSVDYCFWENFSEQSRKNWEDNFNSKDIRKFYRDLLGINNAERG